MRPLSPLVLLTAFLFTACEADLPIPDIAPEPINAAAEEEPDLVEEHDELICFFGEKWAEFPGGHSSWKSFLQRELKYPEEARQQGIEGKAYVNFTVRPDGSLTDIQHYRKLGGGCEEEVVRILESSPPWIPGELNGKKVSSRISVIIPFRLE